MVATFGASGTTEQHSSGSSSVQIAGSSRLAIPLGSPMKSLRRDELVTGDRAGKGVGVPIDELHHPTLLNRRIGARLVTWRENALLIVLDHDPILVIGRQPDLSQSGEIVIPSLLSILVDQPLGADLGFGGADRGDPE